MEGNFKPVPVSKVKEICDEFNKDEVIVISWDEETNTTNIATYGSTKAHCKNAAQGSKALFEYLKERGVISDNTGVVHEDDNNWLKEEVLPERTGPKVFPINEIGPNNQGNIGATYQQIVNAVGFEDNVTDMDDPSKVKASWGFQDEIGRKAFIWCYKFNGNKEDCNHWSIAGSKELLSDIGLFKL